MALMCQGTVDFDRIAAAHGVAMREYFAAEFERLAPLVDAGLAVLEPRAIRVTPAGWYVVRAVAMLFDGHLHRDRPRDRFSKII